MLTLLLACLAADGVLRLPPPEVGAALLDLVLVRDLREPPAGRQRPWPPGLEPSGIIRGRADDRWFWLLNDSGNRPRLYAVDAAGRDAPPPDVGEPGVLVEGVANVDWEELAALPGGRLLVCDTGNNDNARRDLNLIEVPEPDPAARSVAPLARYLVAFADQTEFPPTLRGRNFDCEAVYAVGRSVRLLTKHRGDALARVYELGPLAEGRVNVARPVRTVDFGGMVTAADASPDGRRLLVLTYRTLWLLERGEPGDFFDGSARVSRANFVAGQAEAVCFETPETALIAEERTGRLYRADLGELAAAASSGQ